MTQVATAPGYTLDDLDCLRAELGVAHLELDPWGSLIVSPATDSHDAAVAILHGQALRGTGLPAKYIRTNSPAWKVPGGSGYTNVPDLAVLVPGWARVGELHLDPSPLLVVEVGSPSTRGVDRGRKLSDYRLGRVGAYLLVDLPGEGSPPAFELHDFANDRLSTATASIDVAVGAGLVRFDLAELTATG